MSEEVELVTGSRAPSSPTLRELAAMLFRHIRLMAVSFSLLFVAILIYAFLISARYEGHLKVFVRRGRTDPVVSPQSATSADFARNEITEEELNSQVELLRDEDLLKEVAIAAGLVREESDRSERASNIERAARKLSRALSVQAVKKTNLLEVRYRAQDPAETVRVLSALSNAYLRKHTQLQRPSGEAQFFEQQTSEYARRLHESEDQLVHFTEARGVAAGALERDIALQKLGDAEAEFRRTTQDSAETEHRIAALRQQLASFPARSITTVRSADNPQLLEKMKGRLLDLQLKRSELLTRFEPTYRLVQEVEQEILETRAAIATEGLSPVRDETTDKNPNYEWARMELERAQVQQQSLQARRITAAAQIISLRKIAEQRQADSITQQDLIRNARADEDNYFLYLRKREEARIGDALDAQRILNVAVLGTPVAPALPVHSALFYFAIAFGSSLAFSVVVALTAEYFDPTVRTPDEAKLLTDVPVLAWLPAEQSKILFEVVPIRPRKAATQ